MDWITTVNGLIALLTGLIGLIGTGIGAYLAIKNWISVLKTQNSQEIWALIMEMADIAMEEAEASMQDGETKKQIVIDAVKASCKTAGIDINWFIDQLSDYIDTTIKFVNSMKKQLK
jgi:hypothetical protein